MKRRPAPESSVFALADDVKASRAPRRSPNRFVTGVDIDAIHYKRGAVRKPPKEKP